jgi:large subunit ribosomal protein L24
MKLKRNDKVVMLAGRDKGKSGEITRIFPASEAVLVEGLNVAKRHTKPSNKHPRGGILEISKPIPAGKLALICPSCKKPTRIGYQINGDVKERICRKCKALVK